MNLIPLTKVETVISSTHYNSKFHAKEENVMPKRKCQLPSYSIVMESFLVNSFVKTNAFVVKDRNTNYKKYKN